MIENIDGITLVAALIVFVLVVWGATRFIERE